MLYGHGDNGYQYRHEIIADFSTNVWHGGDPPGLKEHLFRHWKQINKYPEVVAESLTKKAAAHHALEPENILITNGATESIYLAAQAYRHKTSGIIIPSFAEYEDACSMHGHLIHFLDHVPVAEELLQKLDLLWIGNPNNPTGETYEGLQTLIGNHSGITFVVDEAFIDFAFPPTSVISWVTRLPNLIVLRSLTKTFSIPGLRLGYAVACKDLIKKLRALKLPWSVNALALEAGNFIFDRYSVIQPPLKRLLQDKEDFVRQLQQTTIKTRPGHTHFFLCETPHGSAAELQQYLLDASRILIRDASNFRGLGENHFRLATRSPVHNQLLVNALKQWQHQYT
ncbi:MAG: pyridoxal phosphate-dependent class II aminotransferase [Puia sp.]|nr:pyridoxal phosphate-dependent class II aminotransferase [Puia sp.]